MDSVESAGLGGENSGHLIFSAHHTTGDGLLSALQLLRIMVDNSRPLSELSQVMTVYPQTLINVEIQRKPDIDSVAALKHIIAAVETDLGEKGRVLVRYSGTQPLCRVMVEGPTQDQTERHCRQIAGVVQKELGSSP